MNIDEHPAVAGQLGVQSIPAVFAFKNGRPVDGFMGALPEGQVKAFIDRLLGGEGPGADLAEMLKVAGEALEQNDSQTRRRDLCGDPRRGQGEPGRYRRASPNATSRPAISSGRRPRSPWPRRQAEPCGDRRRQGDARSRPQGAGLRRDGQARGRHCRRSERSSGAFRSGARLQRPGSSKEEAVEQLLGIMRRSRTWNDDGARKQLVQFFEAWGPKDEMTLAGRKQLSILFFS